MFKKQMCLFLILAAVFTALFCLGYYGQFFPGHLSEHETLIAGQSLNSQDVSSFDESDLVRNYRLNIDNDHDVLVFLHMQKTGGTTFGRHLVKDLNVTHPCVCYRRRKRCDCQNGNNRKWLFSRYSTGWSCGLHADWTELNDCVDSMLNRMERKQRLRRYFYVTMLRDPIQRYLSEWKQVQRGGTWLSTKLKCNGRQATLAEVPFCFKGENWSGVILEEFNSCRHNLALNRQTRMLANLSLIGCYNHSIMPSAARRAEVMLRSAKDNLRNMAYFGLTEFQSESQLLFEETFQVNFIRDFVQQHNTHASRVNISDEMRRALEEINSLDMELYRYAKELFLARIRRLSGDDNKTVIA